MSFFIRRRTGIAAATFIASMIGSFSLMATSAYAAGSFGISPPFLNADHLVAGATYGQTVYLVQDQPTQDLPIHATLTMSDPSIASWITIDKGSDFIIPQGTRQFPVQVTVHVPAGQSIGKYNGNISFTSRPTQSGQVTIALGANVAINLTVGTGIFENYSVPLITFPDIEEGWNPKAAVKFQNDGNIPESFDSATFEVDDQYDAVRLAFLQKQTGFPKVPAFSTKNFTVEFPISFHLGVGQYWGTVTFYKDQKVVASQKTIFNVLPQGAILGRWGSFLYSLQNAGSLLYGGVIVILLAVITIWFYRRRR